MIICHCRAVNHTTVFDAIDGGAADADRVAAICGAGSVCGGCRPTVEAFLASGERAADVILDLPMPRGSRGRASRRAGTVVPAPSV